MDSVANPFNINMSGNITANKISVATLDNGGSPILVNDNIDLGTNSLTTSDRLFNSLYSSFDAEQFLQFQLGYWHPTLGLRYTGALNIFTDGTSTGDPTTKIQFVNAAPFGIDFDIGDSADPFTTLYIDTIDLGTNTITDGVMVGDWNFGSGNLTTTGNITADTYFGDGSQLTGITGGNLSWNQSLADTLYATIGSSGNPFNQSLNTTDEVTFANITSPGFGHYMEEITALTDVLTDPTFSGSCGSEWTCGHGYSISSNILTVNPTAGGNHDLIYDNAPTIISGESYNYCITIDSVTTSTGGNIRVLVGGNVTGLIASAGTFCGSITAADSTGAGLRSTRGGGTLDADVSKLEMKLLPEKVSQFGAVEFWGSPMFQTDVDVSNSKITSKNLDVINMAYNTKIFFVNFTAGPSGALGGTPGADGAGLWFQTGDAAGSSTAPNDGNGGDIIMLLGSKLDGAGTARDGIMMIGMSTPFSGETSILQINGSVLTNGDINTSTTITGEQLTSTDDITAQGDVDANVYTADTSGSSPVNAFKSDIANTGMGFGGGGSLLAWFVDGDTPMFLTQTLLTSNVAHAFKEDVLMDKNLSVVGNTTSERFFLPNGGSIGDNSTCSFIFYNSTNDEISNMGCV